MNNLVPEKRLDKNGVLTTKHVRAAKPLATGRSLPAPALSTAPKEQPRVKAKQPTKRQLQSCLRHISVVRHETDKGLEDRLGVSHDDSFSASDAQIYSVMSVASHGDAITLLKDGIRTAEEAVERMDEVGLGRLVEDNSALAVELVNRRVYPETYFSVLGNHGDDYPHFLDYVEYLSIDSFFDFHELGMGIKEGKIRLADVKAISAKRVIASDAEREICWFLQEYAALNTRTTLEDAKTIIDNHPMEYKAIRDALEMNNRFGSEFGTTITPESYVVGLSNRLSMHKLDGSVVKNDKQIAKAIKYALAVREERRKSDPSGITDTAPDPITIFGLSEAGVPPEKAAQGMTVQQWEAINDQGLPSSVSGGWL